MIGIKIADGSFFPILEEAEKKKKKVILTTVKDDQPTMQIDLYRGAGSEMANPAYIGTMKIDQISPAPGGDPEIELLMNMDETGSLISKARDLKGDSEKSLSVNIETLSKEETYDIPDFEIGGPPETEKAESPKREDTYETPYFAPYSGSQEAAPAERNYRPLLLIAAAGIVAALLVLGVFYLLPRFRGAEETVPVSAPAVSVPKAEPKQAIPSVSTEAPKSEPVVSKPKSVGVWYSTVKGDNLWNLSRSFYEDPWLYKKIAEENGIANPDLIQQNYRLYIPDVQTGKR